MSDSRHQLSLSAGNMGWTLGSESTYRSVWFKEDLNVEVFFATKGRVRSAYFHAPTGTDRITGGVPSIENVFRMFR